MGCRAIDRDGMLMGVRVVMVVDGVWSIDGVRVGYVANMVVLCILMVCISVSVHCKKI